MFCHHCGQKLPEEARFCFKCGRETFTDVPIETTQQGNGVPNQALALPPSSLAPRITPFLPEEQTYTGEVIPTGEPVVEAEIEGRFPRYSLEPPSAKSERVEGSLDERIKSLLKQVDKARDEDRSEALKLCYQALELDKKRGEIYLKLGRVLEEGHRYEEALEPYEQAVRLGNRPTSAFNVKAVALGSKGRILCKLRRYEEALIAVEESINLDPEGSSLPGFSPYDTKVQALMELQRFGRELEEAMHKKHMLRQIQINRQEAIWSRFR